MINKSEYRTPADLKTRAQSALIGRFGPVVMVTLSYFIWLYLISYSGSIISAIISRMPFFSGINVSTGAQIIFTVISTLIAAFLSIVGEMFVCGLDLYYLNISTGRDATNGDIFAGFRDNPSETFKIAAFLLLPTIIFSLPYNILADLYILTNNKEYLYLSLGFMGLALLASLYMHLTYGIAFFLKLDFPTYSAGKILKLTRQKMHGHRARLFMLDVRFIPMFILCILSFGIGMTWVYPILTEAHTLFFLNLMNPGHYIPIDERI